MSTSRELVPWLSWAQVALLSAWLGAVVIFSAVVAPAAFAVLPSRTLAGLLVGRVLPVLFIAGMTLGAVLLIAELTWRRGLPGSTGAAGAFAVLFAACAVAHFVVGSRIQRLRAAIGGPLDALAPDDPQRVAFGRLHAISVAWLGVALIAALAALAVIALRERAQLRTAGRGDAHHLVTSATFPR